MPCPKCQSHDTRCWDTRTHIYEDLSKPDDDRGHIEMEVGYFACNACDHAWIEEDLAVRDNPQIIDVTDDFYRSD